MSYRATKKVLCFVATCALTLAALTPNAQAQKYFAYDVTRTVWDTNNTADWGPSGGPYNQVFVDQDQAVFEGTGGAVTVSGLVRPYLVAIDGSGYSFTGGTIDLYNTHMSPWGLRLRASGTTTINSTLTSTAPNDTLGANSIRLYATVDDAKLVLTGTNTFTGHAEIYSSVDSGFKDFVVNVRSNGALGATGDSSTTQIHAGSALEVEGDGLDIPENIAIRGTGIASGGALRNVSGDNTWSGNLGIAGSGTARLNSDSGTLTVSGAVTTYTAAGFVVGGDGNTKLTGSLNLATSFAKDGAGTLTITGANSYAIDTNVNAGVLNMQNSTALGTGVGRVAAGATLQLQGGISTAGAQNFVINGAGVADDGALQNASGNNSIGGAVYIGGGGAYARINSSADTLTFNGVVSNEYAPTKTLSIGGAGDVVMAGGINMAAAVTKDGSGTLFINGTSNTLAAGLTVDGGTLGGNGTITGNVQVNALGILSAGNSIDTLTIDGDLDLLGLAVMEINKDGVTLTSDLIDGVGALTYGGTLQVTATGDALANGDRWNLFNADSFAGAFSAYDLPELSGGLSWDVSQLTVDGTLGIVPEPGTLALLAVGLIGLLAYAWRRRK